MRFDGFSVLAALMVVALPGSALAQADSAAKAKRPPSKVAKVAKKVVDSAATAAAAAGVQSLLGKQAGGVANALGAGAPCGVPGAAAAGAAIVGAAKSIAKKVADTTAVGSVIPCAAGLIPGMPAGIPGLPTGIPGMPAGADAAAMAAAAMAGVAGGAAPGGASPLGGLGAVAGMTPIGLAAGAAPGAIKGIKGVLGGKPQDKLAMLRELGKGKLELKHVKFIEGTLEFEPGFEDSFTAFAEAVALVEGTYYMHVAAEAGRDKGSAPDTVLARKRVAKVWALMAAAGVSDQKVFALTELPAALAGGRKAPKAGDAKIEIAKYDKQP
jgi:hypothetical protein